MRNKRKEPLRLKGKAVILEEIAPKYFSYVIEWRNNPGLNQYLNQPYILTDENERSWYENVYLKDNTQGMMIMVDLFTGIAFGTCGWTHMDLREKRCISGRILRGVDAYKGTRAFYESFILLADYLYQFVDIMYAHVVEDNIPSLRLHGKLGYCSHPEGFQYPDERYVQGMEQIELFRTKDSYVTYRETMMQSILKG